jgi:homogentisate 1,2-dioxygenase
VENVRIPLVKGTVSRQARTGWPEGTVEDEHGREGFAGNYSMLYRRRPPTQWTRIEGPTRPRAIDMDALAAPDAEDPDASPALLLENEDVGIYVSRRRTAMPYYFRNVDGDEVHFVQHGEGRLETEYGDLSYEAGDYLVLPRGTTYRFHPSSADSYIVIVESRNGEVSLPERGLLGHFVPFDAALFEHPEPSADPPPEDQDEWEVRVKRGDVLTSFFYDACPMDVVGWVGTLCPLKINVRTFRGIHSERTHLPPSAYATFRGPGYWIVTFTPKPLETAADAVRPPGYHRNVDYDEVIFSHSGRLVSRNETAGPLLTLHPAGVHHGPHPRAFELTRDVERMDAYVINIDTHRALRPAPAFAAAEQEDYWAQWSTPLTAAPLAARVVSQA